MRSSASISSRGLPARVTERVLRERFREGEPVIVLVARGIGATQPYEFRDRDGRSYLLKWEGKLEGHVLRVPWHVWMADGGRLADGVMNQRRLPFALVVLVDWEEKQGESGKTAVDEEVSGAGEGQAGVPASLGKGQAGVPASLGNGQAGVPVSLGNGQAGVPASLGEGQAGVPASLGKGQAGVPASLGEGQAGVPASLAEGDVLCYERMRVMLGGGAMRLRALGWALGMEETELRAMLKREDCPGRVTATGWVRLREEENDE